MIRTAFVASLIGATLATPAVAADLVTPELSPRAEVMQTVGVAEVRVNYSSPGKRDREIWGKLVPYGELWRTGANSATTLETNFDLKIGGQDVPEGKYALFTIPGEEEWTVILNSNPNQGGTGNYDKSLDQARFTVKAEKGGDRERLTFLFSDTKPKSSNLELVWAGVKVSLPIEVDTDAIVAQSIEAFKGDASSGLTDAARHMQGSEQFDGALELINAAIAIERNWFNVWIKATILHDKGDHKEAKKVAENALELGNAAENFFWKDRVEKAVAEWPKR